MHTHTHASKNHAWPIQQWQVNILRVCDGQGLAECVSAGCVTAWCLMHTHTHPSEHDAGGGAVVGGDADAAVTGKYLAQLGTEAVVQLGVEEGVSAGRAHATQVAEQLDEQEVALVDEVDIDVAQHVKHVDGQPAHGKRHHQQRD